METEHLRNCVTNASKVDVIGILFLAVWCVGFFGNSTSILYFGRYKYRKKCFYMLLLFLAVFDNIYLVIKVLEILNERKFLHTTCELYEELQLLCDIPHVIAFVWHMFGVTGSITFTVSITIERYIVICKPFCHQTRPISWKVYVLISLFLTVTLTLIFQYGNRWQYYCSFMVVTLIVIPCLILISLNVLIVKTLIEGRKMFQKQSYEGVELQGAIFKTANQADSIHQEPISTISSRLDTKNGQAKIEKRRKKNAQLAVLSLIIDMSFIVSHLLNAGSACYNVLPPNLVPMSDLLVLMNSSVNFYLFLIKRLASRGI